VTELVLIGMVIILAGFLLVLAAAISARSPEDGDRRDRVRGGGVVMIGPIPIIFGTDAKWASIAIVLAMFLIVVVLLSGVLASR
jgi:uncharacterized protein (TIGR00304 family)